MKFCTIPIGLLLILIRKERSVLYVFIFIKVFLNVLCTSKWNMYYQWSYEDEFYKDRILILSSLIEIPVWSAQFCIFFFARSINSRVLLSLSSFPSHFIVLPSACAVISKWWTFLDLETVAKRSKVVSSIHGSKLMRKMSFQHVRNAL